jgi:hypothetical protein
MGRRNQQTWQAFSKANRTQAGSVIPSGTGGQSGTVPRAAIHVCRALRDIRSPRSVLFVRVSRRRSSGGSIEKILINKHVNIRTTYERRALHTSKRISSGMWGICASLPTLPLGLPLAGGWDGPASASSLSSGFILLARFRSGVGGCSPPDSDASLPVGSGRVLRARRVRVMASQWVR